MESYLLFATALFAVLTISAIAIALRIHSRNRFYEEKYAGVIDVDRAIAASHKKHEEVIQEIESLRASYQEKRDVFDDLVRQAAIYDEELELADLGFYKPHYSFDTPEEYKQKIDEVRRQQKDMVSSKTAVVCTTQMLVGAGTEKEKKARGNKKTKNDIRFTTRAFNNECEVAISATRWNNAARMEKRIEEAVEIVNPVTPTPMRFQLVGYTQATYQGDATPFGLTRACQAEFPESRLCSSVEIMETVDPDAAVGLANGPAWTRPVYITRSLDASGRHLANNTRLSNCGQWTSGGDHGLTVDENGVTRLIPCSSSLAVACCGIRP